MELVSNLNKKRLKGLRDQKPYDVTTTVTGPSTLAQGCKDRVYSDKGEGRDVWPFRKRLEGRRDSSRLVSSANGSRDETKRRLRTTDLK